MFTRLQKFLPIKKIEGYDHPELIETVFRKTLAYEPDGCSRVFNGAKAVLDFGGGCGLHFKQARLSEVRWAVVETPAMVARARELETGSLRFFTDIDSAASWLGEIDLVHSNGAIQYTPSPKTVLDQLCGLKAQRMVWYRLYLSEASAPEKQASYLKDNGPGSLRVPRRRVIYHRTAIRPGEFMSAHRGYQIADRGDDWFHFSKNPNDVVADDHGRNDSVGIA